MFSLNNDLISYPNQLPFSFSFDSNNNQNSKQETTNSSSFIQFPHHYYYSPSFEHGEFGFDQNQNYDLSSLAEVMEVSKMAEEQIPRKRSAKRDRHSKIKTAKGLRDRRMRLSLEVAKRFFGLQDLLGFDKASKTVEWLLNQAKTEIKHLVAVKKNSSNSSASSTSECDVSGLDEVGNRDQQQHRNSSSRGGVKKKKNNNNNNGNNSSSKVCIRKSAFNSVGRERARERARERTREKMMMMTRGVTAHHHDDESNKCNRNLLCSWNPFETTVEHSGTAPPPHTKNVNVIQITEAEAPVVEQEDNPNLFIMNKWSQKNLILNSLNHNLGILLHHDENQFGEFETLGKPCWEAYNNQI